MPKIPQVVLDRSPTIEGLELVHRGKVRDSYRLEGESDKMLVVASGRISIFDFVLNAQIPMKGEILTALSIFWDKVLKVFNPICQTDLIGFGGRNFFCYDIDEFLPAGLKGNPDLQKRATVVNCLAAPDVEDIVRLFLTGSGWKSYYETGMVCGHCLPPGLKDGSRLPWPIYTPTTKAEEGHDEHITADSVAVSHGHLRERLALQCAMAVSAFAESRGIIFADTKFEFSGDVLVDEKGTPDSSRFWDKKEWERAVARGSLPPSLDKQFVRNWGKEMGIHELDPLNPDHVAKVHGMEVPESVCSATTQIYRYIFWRLTGKMIERFQSEKMGIQNVRIPKRKVLVIVGSESDLPQTSDGLNCLTDRVLDGSSVSIISCHRHGETLRNFLKDNLDADVVVAGAGMAAALPGVVKAELCSLGSSYIPVIGVAFKGKTTGDDQNAIGSIEGLPDQPVELDPSGRAYFGAEGFSRACRAAVLDEFIPRAFSKKEAHVVLQKLGNS